MASVLFMLLLACIVIFVLSYNGRFTKKQTITILLVMILLLAGIGALIEPDMRYDLYRHYLMIDRTRYSEYSFSQFLLEGHSITDANYKYTYVYNALLYIIAKVLPNQALPFLVISISYGIFAYILVSEFGDDELNNRNIVLSFCASFVIMPYLYIYSNIRNPLAGAIVSLGLYCYYKHKKLTALIVCSIVAVLIHPIAAAILPFIVLSKIRPGLIGVALTLFFPTIVSRIMERIMYSGGSDFLFKIAAKYYNYTVVRTDNQGRVFLYSTVIVLLIVVILSLQNKTPLITNNNNKYLLQMNNMIIWYSMFSLGYLQNYEMIVRLPYSIAFLSPVIIKQLFNKAIVANKLQYVSIVASEVILLFLALLGLYENIAWLR